MLSARTKIFICACIMIIGSHFPSHVLSPIKDIVKKELRITNTEFGLLQSSELLLQTVTPFVGGAVADVIGPGRSSLLATGAILMGEMLLAFASAFLPVQFQFIVLNVGQLLFGLGAGWIVTVLELILVRAFPQHSLAFAMGSLFAMGKVAGFLATGVSVHIVEWLGFYGGVFWVGLGFTIASMLASLVYSYISNNAAPLPSVERAAEYEKDDDLIMSGFSNEEARPESQVNSESQHVHNWRDPVISLLSFNDCTWYYLLVIRFLIGATWTPFVHLASNITKYMYSLPDADAAWQASLILGLPIVMGPIFGFILDRVTLSPAPQPYFVCLASMFVTLSFFLMDPTVVSSPYPSLVLFALALGCGPLALATLPPLLVKARQANKRPMLGALLGMQSSISHMASSLMDTITGWVQDRYALKFPSDPRNGYTQVMSLFKSISCIGLLASALFIIFWFPPSFIRTKFNRYQWSQITDSNEEGKSLSFPLRRYVYLCIALFLFVITWATFIIALCFRY